MVYRAEQGDNVVAQNIAVSDGPSKIHSDAYACQSSSNMHVVKPGEPNAWSIAKNQIKKDREENGQDALSDKELQRATGNYMLKMKHLNPDKDLNRIKQGDVLNMPKNENQAVGETGDRKPNSHATDVRYPDGERMSEHALTQNAENAKNAINAGSADHLSMGGNRYVTMDDVNKRLHQDNLSAQDRQGLQFIKQHYADLKESNWAGTEGVWASSLDRYVKNHTSGS